MATPQLKFDLEKTLTSYHIESLLGTGATSSVYLATHKTLGRKVAVKVFDPRSWISKKIEERFDREAAIWAHLQHENILHLYDFQSTSRGKFIVMEYNEGWDLQTFLSKPLEISSEFVSSLLDQLCAGLEYLHDRGIVHRDLKPSNLFLTTQGAVKIMDFGISLCSDLEPMTAPGQILGTPHYMSPEQTLGEQASSLSDIFSLGVILFEVLERKKPFRGANASEIFSEIQKGKYPKISKHHPRVFREIIEKTMMRRPSKRIQSVGRLREKNEAFLRRKKIFNARKEVECFLRKSKLIDRGPGLFPEDIVEKTKAGPLATTFRVLDPGELHFSSKRRMILLFLLWLALCLFIFLHYMEELQMGLENLYSVFR